MKIQLLLFSLFIVATTLSMAQDLPSEVKITEDGRLVSGGNPTEGFYNPADVHKLEITLAESNWFQLLDGTNGPNGTPAQTLIGTLTFNDALVLDSVLISIKGQTSDRQNNSEKKSFKIEIDEIIDQDLMGYDNLNLNCAFQDHSSMREVLYYDISRSFSPALKGSFADLYINGQYWGPYNNIQQIEGRYIKEWFTDNEGTRWRAVRPDGINNGPGGPGGIFGTGVSTLNYNGPDSTDYNENYTLKKTEKENPWEDLIEVCDVLNNTPIEDLYDELKHSLDIDRTLWFLAQESVFVDDDSYIYKGGMDYYVYWDHATDRIIPMEVDGNSVLASNHITWDPFYHEDDSDFPLLNRLLQNNVVRQRYLAHIRTILNLYFTTEKVNERIDEFASILDQRVQDDPKKIYSYSQFLNGVEDLKDLIATRIDFLSDHDEINRQGVVITDLQMETSAGIGMHPQSEEELQIRVKVDGNQQDVILYYGVGLDGVFDRIEMYDDGLHGDEVANDNIYGARIPGFLPGNFVRYYVEAIKDDAYSTASYFPVGAQHDVFIYQVQQAVVSTGDVVINEFMADNTNSQVDNADEYDDWLELYNKGSESVDLTGYYLSDDEGDIFKWQFPDNTTIEPDGYLIVWTDNDEDQSTLQDLHANFRLSADGEVIILTNSDDEIIEQVTFEEQQEDLSFARMPNGTGDFQISEPTFNANNGGTTHTFDVALSNALFVYPNPASDFIKLNLGNKTSSTYHFSMVNSTGQQLMNATIDDFNNSIDISPLSNGIYFVELYDSVSNVSYKQKIVLMR
ncbi:MAG: CotH kinase family protein [Bacteroidota bacterium]